MMFFVLLVSVLATLSVAFRPSIAPKNQRAFTLSMANGESKFATKATAGLLAFATSAMFTLAPVQAANYGGFGSSYSEVVDPKKAEVNQETLNTETVKAGVSGVSGLQQAISSIKADLTEDNQLDLSGRLSKDLNLAVVRQTLNKYNEAFSEDTQRGSDRLIRNIIQDITELNEREAVMKPGKARPASKVAIIMKRLNAAERNLNELAAFYPK